MELQRGVCSLCQDNNKVFSPANAEEFSRLLPKILHENFLSESEFNKIKDAIKVCMICCYKIQAANETKKLIKNNDPEKNAGKGKKCYFCNDDKFFIKVKDDWSFFTSRAGGFLKITDYPVCVCPRCFYYFDTIYNIKTKLVYKFPHLATSTRTTKTAETKSNQKQNDTPKRKSLPLPAKSSPTSKKRKIFNDCFTYLQPLSNNNYHVAKNLKSDAKLYRKIAYVNVKGSPKETPKVRPVIKIKLKPKPKIKKIEKSRRFSDIDDDAFTSRPFLSLSKPEEASSKKAKESKTTNDEEKSEKKLDETPKAATNTNLVPKRRVSVFVEPNEESDEKEKLEENNRAESQEKSDSVPLEEEDADKMDEKENTASSDDGKEDEDKEIVNKEAATKEDEEEEEEDLNKDKNHEENGIDKPSEEPAQESDSETKADGNRAERSNSSLSSTESSKKASSDDESGGSDSDTSEKNQVKDNSDGDSPVNTERKKKRVTFSDECN